MALDGVFLRYVKFELEKKLVGIRIDKIQQPNKDELVFVFRSKSGLNRLLMSIRSHSARVHLTSFPIPNPVSPPMFCMLLRKKLTGGKLLSIDQPNLERVLTFNFECTDDLGDKCVLHLICEVMGKYSNVILVDDKYTIIDALKRVSPQMSSKRLILPGLKYSLPPTQDKLSILSETTEKITEYIMAETSSEKISKKILNTVQGISPIVCKIIANNLEKFSTDNPENLKKNLLNSIDNLKQNVVNLQGKPYAILDHDNNMCDITFMLGENLNEKVFLEKDNFSNLLDEYYLKKDSYDRIHAKSRDMYRHMDTILHRLLRKVKCQNQDLEKCKTREQFRVYADIINANLYRIKPGLSGIDLENFYENNTPLIHIKLDPQKSASENAQQFYKEYRKLKTAEEMLQKEIKKANGQIQYIESVLDSIERSETEEDLEEIREELVAQGYLKNKKRKLPKKQSFTKFKEYVSTDGFKILVGRNNKQNDYLTLKFASKKDMWLHVKNTQGSHVVILSEGKDITQNSINEAAQIAARSSKARYSQNVPVDYTFVKNVSKPSKSLPGKVVYVSYKTVYVTP